MGPELIAAPGTGRSRPRGAEGSAANLRLQEIMRHVSPYLRHRRWAAAVVVADAVLWHGADAALAQGFSLNRSDRDLLGRALVFRLVAEQLAADSRRGAALEPYRRVLESLR